MKLENVERGQNYTVNHEYPTLEYGLELDVPIRIGKNEERIRAMDLKKIFAGYPKKERFAEPPEIAIQPVHDKQQVRSFEQLEEGRIYLMMRANGKSPVICGKMMVFCVRNPDAPKKIMVKGFVGGNLEDRITPFFLADWGLFNTLTERGMLSTT